MTVADRINQIVAGKTTQVQLDGLNVRDVYATLKTDFPELSAGNFLGEWESMKLRQIKHIIGEDD